MNIYIWLIVNNSLTCHGKIDSVYICNNVWWRKPSKWKVANQESTFRIQSQSMACVSALCNNAMKTPLIHGSDDILKSDRLHGYPFGLQCCLQLAQHLGLSYSVPDSPVKLVTDMLNWRQVRWQQWPWHNFQVLCLEKNYMGTCWIGPGLSCWKTVTLGSLRMKGMVLGSRTSSL